jgi:hypothetical protein
MPNWRIKAVIHRALSLLPKPQLWNEVFQRHVTKSLELPRPEFARKVGQCNTHLDHLLGLRPGCAGGFTVLEVGTGWHPVMPLGFHLCGSREVWTFDIRPHLRRSRLQRTLRLFREFDQQGELLRLLPRAKPERMENLRQALERADNESPYRVLEQLGIHAQVRDAQQTGLPANRVDLISSTATLEYIPPAVLQNILAEFKRVGSAHAVLSHYLNLADEYSYFDRSITPFNFLQFTERQWRRWNSPLIWQNRLRISDYRALFRQAGFAIVKENNTSGDPADLMRIKLAPEFQHYAKEDLPVLISWLVAVPA